MADRETKVMLRALSDAVVKLAEGQAQLTRTAGKHDKETRELRKLMGQLAKAQLRTEVTMERLGERLDAFRKDVYRGFTGSVARDHSLEKRMTALERSRRT